MCVHIGMFMCVHTHTWESLLSLATSEGGVGVVVKKDYSFICFNC